MIAKPPLLAGWLKATVTCAFPGVALAIVGADGMPVGVTDADDADAAEAPAELVATTVKV